MVVTVNIVTLIQRLNKNVDGSVAPVFGLTLIAMLGCIGLAIDAARAYRTFTHAAASLDFAALSTAKALRLQSPDEAELREPLNNPAIMAH